MNQQTKRILNSDAQSIKSAIKQIYDVIPSGSAIYPN